MRGDSRRDGSLPASRRILWFVGTRTSMRHNESCRARHLDSGGWHSLLLLAAIASAALGCSNGVVATGADASTDASPVLTPDPGVVVCGSSTCAIDADKACCLNTANGAGVCGSVIPGAGCPGDTLIECDEPADCVMGLRCCRYPVRSLFSSFCSAAPCASGELCKKDSDCTTGSCVIQTCAGRVYGYCGALDSHCR